MSGFEPEGPPFDDDLAPAGFGDDDTTTTDVWIDDPVVVEDVPSVEDLDLQDQDAVVADDGFEALEDPPQVPDLPPTDVEADAAAPDPGDAAPPMLPPEPPEPPVLYEEGSLVSQVPVADDLVTVEDITESEVYVEWEAAQASGAAAGPPPLGGGVEPGRPFDGQGMVGDAGDANFWFQQNTKYTCGPAAATQIVNDFLGTGYLDDTVLAARATEVGKLSSVIGMLPEDLEWLLDDQGVPSETYYGQDFEDIERYLREGRSIVMFLDSRDVVPAGYEAFAAEDELENSVSDTVDHFVRVIGIDREAGVAVLANPGIAGGAQVEIPLDRLEEAWNDVTRYPDGQVAREHILIVSDGGDPTPDEPPGTVAQPAPAPVVLPSPEWIPGIDPTLQPAPGPLDPAPIALPTGDPHLPPLDPAPVPAPGPVGEPATVTSATEVVLASPDGAGPRPMAPPSADVALPADPARGPAAAAATTAELVAPAQPDADGGLFDAVPGWVVIPVTLAAGRIGAALQSRTKVARG